MNGTVVQIATKNKTPGESGLPKHPVSVADVTEMGVGDDYNHYRMTEKNGTKSRAVLIYTTDMIATLNQEDWPLEPGHIGENFTIDGIEYSQFEIGTKVQIGSVVIEIAEVCNPCSNLRELPYVGKERVKEFIQTMKGRRGWYAKVLKPGKVHQGDTVTVLD